MKRATPILTFLILSVAASTLAAEEGKATAATTSPYASWANGPSKDAAFFPLAVWLQAPRNAPRYKAIGINLYVGLWEGPTRQQLDELKKHDMPVFCDLNDHAAAHLDEKIVVGWLYGDEPDNAQSLGKGKGYGPPVRPEKVIEDCRKIRARDPSRPVMLNLGQGVAWDGWYGRGVRTNHPEDYPEYVKAGDIVSFDIYPAVHDKPAVAGKLWHVPKGVTRLRRWTNGEKPVWNCIECTHIGNAAVKPTPGQVKAEVWMSIIHGSEGILYFCHQFQPKFIEAGLLADDQMAQAVGAINRQIQALAPVINSPALKSGATVTCDPPTVSPELASALPGGPIALAVRKHQGATYVFAVRMEGSRAKATFRVHGLSGKSVAEVIGEDRQIQVNRGQFADEFGPYAVHLYKIQGERLRE